MPSSVSLFLVCIGFFAAGGCDRSTPAESSPAEPERRPAPSPASPAPAAEAQRGTALRWDDPPGWERVSSASPMRKATYRVPAAAGDSEPAELTVFHFGEQGGNVEANIERWAGQFEGPDRSKLERMHRSSGGLVQHIVEIESGTYASGMPGGPTKPKPGWGLLGGIVETPSGPWFFKLVGPSRTVRGAREGFLGLLGSVKL